MVAFCVHLKHHPRKQEISDKGLLQEEGETF